MQIISTIFRRDQIFFQPRIRDKRKLNCEEETSVEKRNCVGTEPIKSPLLTVVRFNLGNLSISSSSFDDMLPYRGKLTSHGTCRTPSPKSASGTSSGSSEGGKFWVFLISWVSLFSSTKCNIINIHSVKIVSTAEANTISVNPNASVCIWECYHFPPIFIIWKEDHQLNADF